MIDNNLYLEKLAEIKAEVQDVGRGRKVRTWLLAFIGVCLLVLACVIFFRGKRQDYTGIDSRVELRDSIIAAKEETIKMLQEQRDQVMQENAALKKQYATLQQALISNQEKHKQNAKDIQKATTTVPGTKDGLRREFSSH